uniref:V-SNARE coiled-coil homology domain-containing protein n=1 Tax=Arcella intermedia TaxID=1963864 RepID=A0A6B2LEJ2_9EUKA
MYVCIARNEVKLCEYTADSNNRFQHHQITSETLNTVLRGTNSSGDQKTTLQHKDSEVQIYIFVAKGLTTICLTTPNFPKRIPFTFLAEVLVTFLNSNLQMTNPWQTATTLSYTTFVPQLARLTKFHSDPTKTDKITILKEQIKVAQDHQRDTIELLLERGEHIDVLENKTDTLAKESVSFRVKAKQMKTRLWFKNVKLIVILVIVALVAVFFLVWFGCGVPDFKNCKTLANQAAAWIDSTVNTAVDTLTGGSHSPGTHNTTKH